MHEDILEILVFFYFFIYSKCRVNQHLADHFKPGIGI